MINLVDVVLEWYCYSKKIIGLITTLFFPIILFMAFVAEYQKQVVSAKYAKVKYWGWQKDKFKFFKKKFNLDVIRKNERVIDYEDIDVATLLLPRDYFSKEYSLCERKIKNYYLHNLQHKLIITTSYWDYLGEPLPTSGYGSRLIFQEITRSYYSRHYQKEDYFAHPIYYDSYCPIYFNLYVIIVLERERFYSFEDKDFFERLKTRALELF